MRQPLDGITVVSLEQAVAAPFATRQLADLGARVIKIERPGTGDYDRTVHGQSGYFVWLNRGKENAELDVKDPDDRALLGRLIDHADVFVLATDPRFASNTDHVAHNDALTEIIEGAFAGRPGDEVVEALEAAGIASARLRTPADLPA